MRGEFRLFHHHSRGVIRLWVNFLRFILFILAVPICLGIAFLAIVALHLVQHAISKLIF